MEDYRTEQVADKLKEADEILKRLNKKMDQAVRNQYILDSMMESIDSGARRLNGHLLLLSDELSDISCSL